MSNEALREDWIRFQEAAVNDAVASKQAAGAQLALFDYYLTLSDDERRVIDELSVEQLDSDNESIRFVALALIQKFQIASAVPALQQFAERLSHIDGPDAHYYRTWVMRIVDQVTGTQP